MADLGSGPHILEFSDGTLRFLDQLPAAPRPGAFVWLSLVRDDLASHVNDVQRAAQTLGGSSLHELHLKDLANGSHPSAYDYTSVYDLMVFRRLATEQEVRAELPEEQSVAGGELRSFRRVRTRAVAFAVFDRLLISVHPPGCDLARAFIGRYLGDAVQSEGLHAGGRSRLPSNPSDLMLRMINVMVDSYLDLRKTLGAELGAWQEALLAPRSRGADWAALMTARAALHTLDDLCEEQSDAMQEWLDTLREQAVPAMAQAERDSLLARARDVTEHVQRVMHHVRRMEHDAETAVQIHFSALSHRTNDVMRVLTALTAVFLPLNFMTGFFGMNFEFLPFIHSPQAFWTVLGVMVAVAVGVVIVFWRKRYLGRTAK